MRMRRSIVTLLTTSALAIGLIAHSLAAPPGGKGGGKNSPSLSVVVTPDSLSEADAGALGVVSRENSDTSVALTVTLESSDTSEATVDATVEIPAGEVSAEFAILAEDDTVKDGDQTVTITATAANHAEGAASITVVDDDLLPPIVYMESPVSLPPGTTDASLTGFNDLGMAAGFYSTEDPVYYRAAYLYDPTHPDYPDSAFDLNTLNIQGLNPDWFLRSAVGLNNNGLIVGYIALVSEPTVRRGFVLDYPNDPINEPAQLYEIPDSGRGWVDTYARKVNDNGDIHGVFERADGTFGAYLYNPGLRDGAHYALKEIDLNVASLAGHGLSNPPLGEAPKLVMGLPEGGIAEYTLGDETIQFNLDTSLTFRGAVNDIGEIASSATITETIQINKKKTETTTSPALYRDLNDTGEKYIPIDNWAYPVDINNHGTVISHRNLQYPPNLYHDDWGIIELYDITASSNDLITSLLKMNEAFEVQGFTQIAARGWNSVTGEPELYILTPILLP